MKPLCQPGPEGCQKRRISLHFQTQKLVEHFRKRLCTMTRHCVSGSSRSTNCRWKRITCQTFQVEDVFLNIDDLTGKRPVRVHAASSKINEAHTCIEAPVDETSQGASNEKSVNNQEVIDLVKKLADTPEIRPDRIAEIQKKIQSDGFLTRQAAEATAEAFLR